MVRADGEKVEEYVYYSPLHNTCTGGRTHGRTDGQTDRHIASRGTQWSRALSGDKFCRVVKYRMKTTL